MPGTWDPEWLEFAKTMGEAPTLPEELNEAKRQAVNGLLIQASRSQPPAPEGIISKELQVPDGPKVRAYKPDVPEGTPLSMIIFIHGGGWFAGNLDTEDRTCALVCGGVPAWVVSVEYACDFDVPIEREVDDCYKAFVWAQSRAELHGVDPNKMIVWGGSAGGVLAIATMARIICEGKGDQVAGLVTMCGLTLHPDATPKDYKHLMKSYVDNAGPLPFVSGQDTLDLYKQRNIEPPNTDLNVFPAAGGPEHLKSFPRTYLITADNDASRDDGTVLEAILRDAGVEVKRDNFPGLFHYFWVFPLPKVNARFWRSLTEGFRWTLEA